MLLLPVMRCKMRNTIYENHIQRIGQRPIPQRRASGKSLDKIRQITKIAQHSYRIKADASQALSKPQRTLNRRKNHQTLNLPI